MKNLFKLLNLIMPPRCFLCGILVEEENGLCPDCFSKIQFIGSNICPVCGHPHVLSENKGVCALCLDKHPFFDKTQSAFYYDDFSKGLILPFKHMDRTDMCVFLCRLLERVGNKLIEESDLIIPVPLHYRRLLSRKYNQSALLACLLAKRYKKRYAPLALKRVKNTPSQGHKTATQREENVKNAFLASSSEELKNKTVLLIDDVFTTGATLNACAKELKRVGVRKVLCLTLARTRHL